MYEELLIKMRDLNNLIKEKSAGIDKRGREGLKKDIYNGLADKYMIEDDIDLEKLADEGGLWAVDGSLGRIGSLYPHYISVIDALVISTKKGFTHRKSTIYSPMQGQVQEEDEFSFESEMYVKKEMARLEVRVTIEALEKETPKMIFMDGGFIRYIISCKEDFEELKKICIERGIILAGVIEEIKTSILGKELDLKAYDREILFSLLDYKEAMLIKDEINNKAEEGITSAFVRTSMKPYAIGVDISTEQKDAMKDVLKTMIMLTPKDSRGIPIILDIVDKKVKITDELKQRVLVKELDKDVYDRYFNEVRNFR